MAYTTIDDPEAHFQVVTYTGDGREAQAQTTSVGTSNLKVSVQHQKHHVPDHSSTVPSAKRVVSEVSQTISDT